MMEVLVMGGLEVSVSHISTSSIESVTAVSPAVAATPRTITTQGVTRRL